MHRRVTVNGKTYVEPTGDIGTFSEFVSHTAVQIEIEVAPKETAGVQYYPLLSILFRADHFFPYMVSKGYASLFMTTPGLATSLPQREKLPTTLATSVEK